MHPVPAPNVAPLAALHTLLDACQALSPEYGAGLSTHLPMALEALHSLGASAARLQACFERGAARVPTRARAGALATRGVAAAGAVDHLGPLDQAAQFEPLRASLLADLTARGAPAVLQEWLPRLMPGVAAVAFHGLIRTAHGLACGHTGELASGLAYWAVRFQPMPTMPAEVVAAWRPWPEWLAGLRALPKPGGATARLISDRMAACAAVPGFAAAAALRGGPDTLDGLAVHAASVYAATGNFTVLHLVTACQAMRRLQSLWRPDPLALGHFSAAAAAALLASGVADAEPAPHAAAGPWPTLLARAIDDDDEHVVKLVAACLAHQRATGDTVFQAAASRALAPWATAPAPPQPHPTP